MLVELSSNAADLITELALDEMKAVESGTSTYGNAEANIAAIELLCEIVDLIEHADPRHVIGG